MGLTAKRQVFIEEYLRCWNATEAARRARYAYPGRQGHRLLKNVEIQELIKERIAEKALSADEVLLRLGEQARASIAEFIDEDGIIDWGKVQAKGHLIKSVVHRKGRQSRIELYDAQNALVHLGKHHRLFVERRELTGADGGPIAHNLTVQFEEAVARIYDDGTRSDAESE